jgi:peptidoglycan/xylan/chitin deacetylase (PgdA/CDA1 family)
MPEPVTGQLLSHGPRDVPKVAITFDTAFSADTAALTAAGVFPPQFNEPVLDYLDAESVPATMFVTGVWAEAYPQAMERIAATERFELANHTWSHAGWTDDCYGLPSPGDETASRFEIARSAKLISEYTGQWPSYIRFPGLCHDLYDVALAAEYGSRTVDADVTIFDSGMTDATGTAMGIMSQVQPGSIILLHLNGPPNAPVTLDILKQVLPALRERGLTPVTVSELLAPVESGEPTG